MKWDKIIKNWKYEIPNRFWIHLGHDVFNEKLLDKNIKNPRSLCRTCKVWWQGTSRRCIDCKHAIGKRLMWKSCCGMGYYPPRCKIGYEFPGGCLYDNFKRSLIKTIFNVLMRK